MGKRGKPRKRKLKGKREHVASNGLTHTKIIEYSRKVLKRPGTMWKCGVTFAELSTANSETPDILGFYSGGVFFASTSELKTAKGKAIIVIQE